MLTLIQAQSCLQLRKDCTIVFNLRDTAFLNQHCPMFHDSKLSCSDMFIPKQEAGTPQIMRCQIASPTRLIRTSSLRP
jgi:hypothetical protein